MINQKSLFRLPSHLEFVNRDGMVIFGRNVLYCIVRNKETGEEQKIILPQPSIETDRASIVRLFQRAMEEQLNETKDTKR